MEKEYLYDDSYMIKQIIGKHIKRTRRAKHVTYGQLVAKKVTGDHLLSRIESGKGNVRFDSLMNLVIELDMPLKDAFEEIDYYRKHGHVYKEQEKLSLETKKNK